MKGHKEQTKRLVTFLRKHPVVVADIFEYGADGTLVPDIVTRVSEYWKEELDAAGVYLSEHYIWSMFHRRRPFHDASLYSQVCTEKKERVSARLYSTDPKFKLEEDVSKTHGITNPTEKQVVITNVLHARVQYERCLQDARMAGVDIDVMNEWIDIAIEQELMT